MTTNKNDITGDALISKTNTKGYEDGWDKIFKTTCKKCGGTMHKGKAIKNTLVGIPDFIGGEVCTVSPGGPGTLISCLKCEQCGWSISI